MNAARSSAPIDAVSRAALTKTVWRSAPFQRSTEPATNPAPSAVSVNASEPATALAGLSAASDGTGFGASASVRAEAIDAAERFPEAAAARSDR